MDTEIVTPRIAPVEPPFDPETDARLTRMMPPGVPPIALFRTFVRNVPMTDAMQTWGSYELGRRLSLSMRDREIVIDRTCARCRCEYELGVHVAFFAERVGLDPRQLASLAIGSADDDCWTDPRDRALIRAVDALHDDADIAEQLWDELASHFTEEHLLDLLLLCGWYHAISFVATAARVPLEAGAPTFASLARAAAGAA
jgi:alkylhydroperoxidase family enzyme